MTEAHRILGTLSPQAQRITDAMGARISLANWFRDQSRLFISTRKRRRPSVTDGPKTVRLRRLVSSTKTWYSTIGVHARQIFRAGSSWCFDLA